ncbi:MULTISPECIES: glycerol-3-phosphate dehydrogenase [Rhodopseudomonas]|uniref:Glycerol-3-phosphate dehydrogenase n=1 Tax=Rhodopseudomonas palustris TaxID=1076 RepID=A0A0D7F1J5_RHOPL|nr:MULTISPECIES: glycerol-3-phosphate dehydrogenase [Rhodopseudomonas]KIZ46934.1 glycerol-3-phosphate dehydrogenase [Rhodopseudomonas palustris]MDF3809169.1 glycerol-3-phosphate dehydrogenase [Rhodopseudomonas sp. BAL398]WOK17304.1 glycerol-3-phosphate dehydrogenase [Rhodopseudomonas sp. BAL398]
MEQVFDLAIIGGGINGCGIARDAAGRGNSVFLCEMNDLASGTSSWSTKLIHGGLRYLEYFEFRLVREALIERERLWAIAPHIIRPLRFVLPHHAGLRPAWRLRLGLLLYDHIGGRKLLPPTRAVDLAHEDVGKPLSPGRFSRGFEYSDCFVDDARLVVLTARDAAARGAEIRTRTRAVEIRQVDGIWHVTLADTASGERRTIQARALVNAAGPWVETVLSRGAGVDAKAKVRLVQGSHIVVPRLYDHDRAYMFQNADGRIVFVIPYQDDFTLIGTTDRDYEGDPSQVTASAEEISYLCESVSAYLARPVTPADVVWTFSGVRPLYDDGASEAKAATREYVFELDTPGGAPLLSIFGGKITTYRRLAEEALEKLSPYLHGTKAGEGWTAQAPLPGGDFPVSGVPALITDLLRRYPFLTPAHAGRLAHAYGTLAQTMLGDATQMADLGRDFGATLTESEVRYLMAQEWACSADDIVWRRSKLGLRLTADEIAAIDDWIAANRDPPEQSLLHAGGRA